MMFSLYKFKYKVYGLGDSKFAYKKFACVSKEILAWGAIIYHIYIQCSAPSAASKINGDKGLVVVRAYRGRALPLAPVRYRRRSRAVLTQLDSFV
jgi:hypothetical protein